jgi:hypothetical protein
MIVAHWDQINQLAVKQAGKPAVYVGNGLMYDTPQDDDIWKFVMAEMKSIYGDNSDEFYSIMLGLVHGGMFFFDSEEEQGTFFRVFMHPRVQNSAMFACTYGHDGECHTTNT